MDRYIGTYRVDIERDIYGNPLEITYIRGSGNYRLCKIYRFNATALRLYCTNGIDMAVKLDQAGVMNFGIIHCSREAVFQFAEKDIDSVAAVIKARKKGKGIKPKSKRNKRVAG